ncbi:MAG TPA: hypothetical protein PKK26_09760 [Candidatus Wallbacteria bacterium]|nr:hypothetical protein [Candidatus Wallbacteria bacterium]
MDSPKKRRVLIGILIALSCFITGTGFADPGTLNPFSLKITGISKDEFPKISIDAYFKKDGAGSENGLLQSNFTLTENRWPQNLNYVKRKTDSKALAFIIDKSLHGDNYAAQTRSALAKAASYLESIDAMGLFTFSANIDEIPFSSDPSKFANVTPAQSFSPELSSAQVISRTLDAISDRVGERHIIYMTADDIELSDETIEKCTVAGNPGPYIFHILKFPVFSSSDLFGGGSASERMASLSKTTGGQYVEAGVTEMTSVIEKVMNKIKSNYELGYQSSMPYSNGQKRTVTLSADFMNAKTTAETSYTCNFNLPEISFGNDKNPVYYQEINPVTIENANELGLSISASVCFKNNAASAPMAKAFLGFGSYDINGRPEGRSQFVIEINNCFEVVAAKYRFSGGEGSNYFEHYDSFAVRNERIETVFLKNGTGSEIKKAGIYWQPVFKNNNYKQWVRIFMSFKPEPVISDGSIRYAIFLTGTALDGKAKDIGFDGIQLQYGAVPTVFTEIRTLYFGPDDIRQTIIQPLNPRIEYQMK